MFYVVSENLIYSSTDFSVATIIHSVERRHSEIFEGCKLKNNSNGIHMTMSKEGRPSGEAYVEFETAEDADKGLEKNNEHLGNRYIEVFRSKENEMEWALRRCGLDGQEAFGDACVRLRGLPFGCSKEEIAQFSQGWRL
ncbi:heterogeneous nuclear ribonucleoprotein H2 [Caerostris extrusa]|uniref:Heterogeneous nuclear ribonucleoprotein H2 n=1 Tax=Caerostris extrusa TaxID=172846 RepID=A0AAV4UL01_CAEEX|nr:heterogeneous nuclear ribonucleoprotein H2 [Caerostris extrusa]